MLTYQHVTYRYRNKSYCLLNGHSRARESRYMHFWFYTRKYTRVHIDYKLNHEMIILYQQRLRLFSK